MVFKLGLIFTLILANCIAHEGYPRVRPYKQLFYERYSYQNPRYQWQGNGIPGVAGKDYPLFRKVPQTRFDCDRQQHPGYYADPEADCQAFHVCQRGGRKDSFLCPNGTLFNQERLVCAWWNTVDCPRAQSFYSINEAVAKAMEEADRRIKLAAEGKLSRGYQRESNVESGSGNKYNQLSEQRRWNKNNIPIRRNQNLDFTEELPYESPETSSAPGYDISEFSAKRLPGANTRYGNFYSSKWNHKIIGAEFGKQTRKNNCAKSNNAYLPIY
nr:PREDICTED: LOW QUALITY PROTEIN: uncharacterized protein LOC105675957 [Linepithema humile]